MTAKKPSDTAKTAALKAAAELKADEVAAMMGDDVETSATQKPSAPPALKGSAKSEPEAEEKAPEKSEEQADAAEQAESEGTVKTAIQDDVDAGEDEPEDQDDDGEQEEVEQAKAGHMVILTKTIQTKDKDGKDVKFIASKDPQDLGEYGDMAIAAGCAKPHKAG
jgi:hypothetical protein